MDAPSQIRVDRSKLETLNLHTRTNGCEYWLLKTPEERFEALELLRQISYGYDPATAKLQRVLEVAKLERH